MILLNQHLAQTECLCYITDGYAICSVYAAVQYGDHRDSYIDAR